jgi:hypothetical protein
MPHHRVRDAAHQGSPHTAAAPATHNYQPRPYLFAKCDYLRYRLSHTQVCLCDRPSSRLYLPDFLVEQLSFCPLDIRQEVRKFPRDPSRFQRREFDEGRFIEALPADVDTCNSDLVFSARSVAVRAACLASTEPSVAKRILVGKMLI